MNKGFSLVEVLVVIIVLGVLSTMALGKFGDFTPSAANASAAAVAGAMGSAAADYNAKAKYAGGNATALTCATAFGLLTGVEAADYTVGGGPICTVRHQKGTVTYNTASIN